MYLQKPHGERTILPSDLQLFAHFKGTMWANKGGIEITLLTNNCIQFFPTIYSIWSKGIAFPICDQRHVDNEQSREAIFNNSISSTQKCAISDVLTKATWWTNDST
jgi:hypothetical protein